MTERQPQRGTRSEALATVVRRVGRLRARALRSLVDEESGSAVVEFIMLGVILLVPLVYLILTAGQIQAASYAAVGAADHAAHAFATARDESTGAAKAQDAAARAGQNMGFSAEAVTMGYSCTPGCMQRDGTVTVEVSIDIQLPLLPPGVDAGVGAVGADATRIFGGL